MSESGTLNVKSGMLVLEAGVWGLPARQGLTVGCEPQLTASSSPAGGKHPWVPVTHTVS